MTSYMNIMKEIEEEAERAGKEAYGGVDMVNEPPHYNKGDIQCINAIEAALTKEELRGYFKGNLIKYLWREQYKNGNEDILKCQFYLNRMIEKLIDAEG